MIRAALCIHLLLAAHLFAADEKTLSESNVERLERQLLASPKGHYYEIFKIRRYLGGSEALDQRWEKKFRQATGGEKERWALLLAIHASPKHREVDTKKAKQWLEQAGDGFEAHSYRATVASLENDPAAAAEHLKAALRARPDIDVLQLLHVALKRLRGEKHSIADDLSFWKDAWISMREHPEVRLAVAGELSKIQEQLGKRDAWLAQLKLDYLASPQTAWVEAFARSRVHLRGREGDLAWSWLQKGKDAGAPERVYVDEYANMVTMAENHSPLLHDRVNRIRMRAAPSSGTELIQFINHDRLSAALDKEAAAYLRKHATLALNAPLDWLAFRALVDSSRAPNLRKTPQLKKVIFDILKAHTSHHPDDLEARYVLGQLLAASHRRAESAAVLDAFIRDAMDKVNQVVEGQSSQRASTWDAPFALRFPSSDDLVEVKKPRDPDASLSVFQIDSRILHSRELRSAYPNATFADMDSYASTMGDLLLSALMQLRKMEGSRFQKAYRRWVQRAKPPLMVKFDLAVRIHRSLYGTAKGSRRNLPNLVEKIVQDAIADDNIPTEDVVALITKWNLRNWPPELMRQLGDILVARRPRAAVAMKTREYRILLEDKNYTEAEKLFRYFQKHVRPDSESDADEIWRLSFLLANASGNAALELSKPKSIAARHAPESEEKALARVEKYFKQRSTTQIVNSELVMYQMTTVDWLPRLLIAPGNLLPDTYADIMHYWGMNPIDPALSIYESGFANGMMYGDHRKLTPEQYRKLANSVGSDDLRLAMVRAFYDGSPAPEEQLKRVNALVAKHPDLDRLRAVLAGKNLGLGRYKDASEAASRIKVKYGDMAWFANVVKLICAKKLKDIDSAKTAARSLIPITYRRSNREWLMKELAELKLRQEADAMLVLPPYLAGE